MIAYQAVHPVAAECLPDAGAAGCTAFDEVIHGQARLGQSWVSARRSRLQNRPAARDSHGYDHSWGEPFGRTNETLRVASMAYVPAF